MIVKLFEIRDSGTFISAIAIQPSARSVPERMLLSRAGYGKTQEEHKTYVLLARLETPSNFTHDAFDWSGSRTMHQAHLYLNDHFDELESGAVIDVQFILGETDAPKGSDTNNIYFL